MSPRSLVFALSALALGCNAGRFDVDLVHATFEDPYRGLDSMRVSILDATGAVLSKHDLDPFAPNLQLTNLDPASSRAIRVEGLSGGMVTARGESALVRLADGAPAVPITFSTLQVAVALPAAAITSNLKIDGKLDDWVGAPVAAVLEPDNAVFGTVKNEADLSAKIYLAWRQDGLYVGIHVLDNCVVCDPDHPDKVIVSYDGHGDRESGTYGADDGNITVGPTLQDLPTGVEAAASAAEGGYAVEIKIAWSALDISPPSGPTRIGFEVELFDGSDGAYQKVEAWAPSPDPLNSRPFPSQFGSMGLEIWP